MISVLLYGRNDAHGYNLHRRAALSLNCLAEVLTDPDDEILFVDYNTPDELPTFVEALSDTLTERCLERLRVIRVPAALHEQRFAARTHLSVVEPVARNVAARRANPANRWLLSTNTDMIFLPLRDESLSDICGPLEDGYYGLPRFELPEWLWEQLPRHDPGHAMAEIRRFGPALRLDEPTVSHEWVRFDAPGDFQLVVRDDFLAVHGFDEEMLLGWHVDSNLSRRMSIHRGSIQSLDSRLAGYHCNHNRIPTVYHGAEGVANDLDRFFYSIEAAEVTAQRATWGLADEDLGEVPIRERRGGIAESVLTAIPAEIGPLTPSDAAEAAFGLSYDSGHVLPFIADSLVLSPPGTSIGYIGVNPVLERMLASLVARLGFGGLLVVTDLEDPGSIDELIRIADVVVVDLGLDRSLFDPPKSASLGDKDFPLPVGLDQVFAALERFVELERSRLESGEHHRRIVLVNSSAHLWDGYVVTHLVCSHTTTHSRVRRATVRLLPAEQEAAQEALVRQRRLLRWAARGAGMGRLALRPGENAELADLADYGGFDDGWAYPDEGGIWTQGPRSELAVGLEGMDERDHVLVLSLNSVCVGVDDLLHVDLLVNGERVAGRDFSRRDPGLSWVIDLPAQAEGMAELTFEIAEPRSPLAVGWSSDDRPLGVLIGDVRLLPADDEAAQEALVRQRRLMRWAARAAGQGRVRLRRGEPVPIDDLADYGGFGRGWAYPDEAGIWTEGPRAELALSFEATDESEHVLSLSLMSVCVGADDSLRVDVLVNGKRVAARDFSLRDPGLSWVVDLPTEAVASGEADLTFEIAEPRSPLEVGWSSDDRPLGILIAGAALLRSDEEAAQEALVRQRQLMRWAARAPGLLHLRADEPVELARLDDYAGFGHGWAYPDEGGIWTQGPRSELAVALEGIDERDHVLVLSLNSVCVGVDDLLHVDLLVNGERVAGRDFSRRDPGLSWVIDLPAQAEGKADLTFEIAEPRSPLEVGWSSDERPLGLFVRDVAVEEVDRSLAPGDNVEFRTGSDAQRLLGKGWSMLEPTGVWTIDEHASLLIQLANAGSADVEAVLGVSAFVTPEHPELEVEALALNQRLAARVFRHGDADGFLRVPLPASARDGSGHALLELRLRHPVAPADLGISDDARRLGLHLRSLAIRKRGLRTSLRTGVSEGVVRARARLRPMRRFARRARSRSPR